MRKSSSRPSLVEFRRAWKYPATRPTILRFRQTAIINVVVHTPKPFLYDSINAASSEVNGEIERTQHSGKYIAEVLAEQIQKLGKHKVVAVVTDHAANMKNAWKKLAGENTERNPQRQYTVSSMSEVDLSGSKAIPTWIASNRHENVRPTLSI